MEDDQQEALLRPGRRGATQVVLYWATDQALCTVLQGCNLLVLHFFILWNKTVEIQQAKLQLILSSLFISNIYDIYILF